MPLSRVQLIKLRMRCLSDVRFTYRNNYFNDLQRQNITAGVSYRKKFSSSAFYICYSTHGILGTSFLIVVCNAKC
ncbi:unnamed protein product [Schistosoma rodhaini]|nr:unnamed protein product [Schistosoma rodhaini]